MPFYQTVLIVDDDPITRQLLEAFARGAGALVTLQAENGSDAARLLKEQDRPFDLIFCDLEMPEMDGIEFLNHLKSISFQGAIAIISGAHRSVVESAAKLASLHGLNFLGRVKKPPTKAALDALLSGEAPPEIISSQ